MKYFMIALIATSSLNAMRFGEPEAQATADAIKSVVGAKPGTTQPQAKTPKPSDSTTKNGTVVKSKL